VVTRSCVEPPVVRMNTGARKVEKGWSLGSRKGRYVLLSGRVSGKGHGWMRKRGSENVKYWKKPLK
jgi:hypothetical protein